MKRRTLDIIFSVGGLVVAMLVLVLGLVLQNQADFAKSYVHDQLSAQKITFTPAKFLAPEEKKSVCLVDNAGKALVTGKQAECYANKYIALHLTEINEGKTYSETSSAARGLDAQIAAAKTAGDTAKVTALTAEQTALNGKVQTLFRGETLRGLLLTSYGFSIFGERAQQAATVCFAVAFVLLLAAIAGFVHAATKGADKEIVHTA
jgi:hypothetical protein